MYTMQLEHVQRYSTSTDGSILSARFHADDPPSCQRSTMHSGQNLTTVSTSYQTTPIRHIDRV